jgi:hypothetical protein
MMFHPQGALKQSCTLLAVTCGENSGDKLKKDAAEDKPRYPFPEFVSSGRLEVQYSIFGCNFSVMSIIYEMCRMLIFPCSFLAPFTIVIILQVQTLTNPSKEEFCKTLESYKPSIVYLQGAQLENDEVGPLVWEGVDMSAPEAISEIFATALPTAVCDII